MKWLAIFAFMLIDLSAFSQSGELDSTNKTHGLFQLEFNTNAIYLGRKDSLPTPYLSPTIGYYHKSGAFIEGSLSYLTRSSDARVDGGSLRAGYDFSVGNFTGEAAAEKNFYNSNSTNVKSEIKASLSFMADYDFGPIEATLQPVLNFGSKNDFVLQCGLDHEFDFDNINFSATPTAILNAGTKNFYKNYIGEILIKNNRKNVTVNTTIQSANSVNILDYELSLPLIYKYHQFAFGLSPTYCIAKNPIVVQATITRPSGTTYKTVTENVSNTFFLTLNAAIKF